MLGLDKSALQTRIASVKKVNTSLLGCALVVFGALASPLAPMGCSKSEPTTPSDAPSGGKISAAESTHDFGTITEGDSVKFSFVLKNDGSGPLTIDRVQSSCACLTTDLKKKEIPPGATGDLEITFNTQGRPGEQSKSITVMSNDSSSPRLNLTIKAKVEPLLAFDLPRYMASKSMRIGDKETIETWVTGKLADGAKLAIESSSGGEDAVAEVVTKTEGDKQKQGVKVQLKAAKIGNYQGNVVLTTGVEKAPKLTFTFNWNVLGNVDVTPRSLFFGIGGPASPTGKDERVIQLKSRLPDFKVKGVKVVSGPFTTKLMTPDAGTGYEVHVTLTDREKLDKAAKSSIEISTNDPIESTISVPIAIASARPRPMGPMPSMMPKGPPPPPSAP